MRCWTAGASSSVLWLTSAGAPPPSLRAMRHIGKVYNEGNSDSTAMIVLEGDKPLGDAPLEASPLKSA